MILKNCHEDVAFKTLVIDLLLYDFQNLIKVEGKPVVGLSELISSHNEVIFSFTHWEDKPLT